MDNKYKIQWNSIKEKYFDQDIPIEFKKLPLFYDFYNPSVHFKNVYEPAEDTFLLIDALRLDEDILKREFNYTVELGCGNGLVSCCFVSSAKHLNKHYCIDINNDALSLTWSLLKHYQLDDKVSICQSDLFKGINPEVKFDLVIFNPPYVTTEESELEEAQVKKDISAAWAGGENGSKVILQFIKELKNYIHKETIIILLLSEENEYGRIINLMKEQFNFDCECLLKRKARNEKLGIFKFKC